MNFLAVQKIICSGVSSFTFRDSFQMGKCTVRKSIIKYTDGIVECSTISDYHMRSHLERDTHTTVVLHKKAYDIDGYLGSFDMTKIH